MTHRQHPERQRSRTAKMVLRLAAIVGLAVLAVSAAAGILFAQEGGSAPRTITLKAAADRLTIISALPKGERAGEPYFDTRTSGSNNRAVSLETTEEPVWIIEGDLPAAKNLSPEKSPFGFHPAAFEWDDYSYARDLGVVWDRGGRYLIWVLMQPDLSGGYRWQEADRHFMVLPEGMLPLKNITVAFDGWVNGLNRRRPDPLPPGKKIDFSSYLEGTTYRPKDPDKYSSWVKAVVERYDGDGVDDMPGLRIPARHWQADNEPPRGREGYVDFVLLTSRAIKEADPGAKVLMGGLQLPCGEEHNIDTYHRVMAPLLRELSGRAVDIVDFHWFGYAGEWKKLPEAMATVRKDLAGFGFRNTAIWFTEMGTYSGRPQSRLRLMPVQSERQQASEMLKRYAVALSEGVEKIFWAWGIKEGFKDSSDNDFFDNTGFIYDGKGPYDSGKNVRKTIYYAYRQMTRLLEYWDGSPPGRIEAAEGVYAYRFRFNAHEDRGIILAWKGE